MAERVYDFLYSAPMTPAVDLAGPARTHQM